MANRNPGKGKRGNFWQRMDERSRMFFVLSLCSVGLLISVIAAFIIVRTASGGSLLPGSTGETAVVSGSDYDQTQNQIDASQYDGTVLAETQDAGQDYIDSTLFLGDSNTARMYRLFDYCSYDNAIGSVGMSARQLASYECVQFEGYSGYKTMPEAVALMQPERVIITFGTNDAGTDTDTFISNYKEGIQAVQDAYPSVDIIINAVPPIGRNHINSSLDQSQLDEYNKAIAQMCEENGWKFLNSAEVLKGSDGYAKDGYTESDGIHLTSTAMDVLFNYIRTHSYITEDDRPVLTTIPEHTGDKDVSAQTASSVVAPSYTYWDEVIAPTCTEKGYTVHHCNEDPSKDYIDSETPATGHSPQTQADGSIVCSVCGAVLQAAPATPTPTPTPAPTPAPTPTPAPVVTPTPDTTTNGEQTGGDQVDGQTQPETNTDPTVTG